MPHPHAKVTAHSVEIAERKKKILELRIRDIPYRRIASELGIDVGTAYRDSVEALNELVPDELRDQARKLEGQRLGRLWHRAFVRWEKNDKNPDDEAFIALSDLLLRIQQRRSRLYGLDEEKKVRVTGSITALVGVERVNSIFEAVKNDDRARDILLELHERIHQRIAAPQRESAGEPIAVCDEIGIQPGMQPGIQSTIQPANERGGTVILDCEAVPSSPGSVRESEEVPDTEAHSLLEQAST